MGEVEEGFGGGRHNSVAPKLNAQGSGCLAADSSHPTGTTGHALSARSRLSHRAPQKTWTTSMFAGSSTSLSAGLRTAVSQRYSRISMNKKTNHPMIPTVLLAWLIGISLLHGTHSRAQFPRPVPKQAGICDRIYADVAEMASDLQDILDRCDWDTDGFVLGACRTFIGRRKIAQTLGRFGAPQGKSCLANVVSTSTFALWRVLLIQVRQAPSA